MMCFEIKITECKDCTERMIGCHATCDDYRRMKIDNAEIAEKVRKHNLGISGNYNKFNSTGKCY